MEEWNLLYVKNVLTDSDILMVLGNVGWHCNWLESRLMSTFAFCRLTFECGDVRAVDGDCTFGIVGGNRAIRNHVVRQHVLKLCL